MRLMIDNDMLDDILKIVSDNKRVYKYLKGAIESAKKSNMSNGRVNAIKKTNELRVQRSRETILNAIEKLRREGSVVNASRVAKLTGLNYNTVHKHFKEIISI